MRGSYLKLFVDCLEKYQRLNDAEFGRLIRAALSYKGSGEEAPLTGREELLWDSLKLDIDRDNQKYDAIVAERKKAGKKGSDSRWQTAADDGKNSNCHLPHGKNGQDKDEDKDKDKDKDSVHPPAGDKDPHGAYGHVKLTDAEYQDLIAELGEKELARCIRYVDESAQGSGNKNRWRDWALILRRCHRDGWGLKGGRGKAASYPQHEFSRAELDALLVDLDGVY